MRHRGTETQRPKRCGKTIRGATAIILILCWVAGAAGCGSRNTKRRLSASDVAGTWRMTSAAKALLQRDGIAGAASGKSFTITFNADGAVRFASAEENPAAKGSVYRECGGTWHLEHDTTGNDTVHKTNTIKLELDGPNGGSITYLNFTGEGQTLKLWTYYGDPDNDEYIEYERE